MKITIVALLALAFEARAQTMASRVTSAADQALLTQLVDREDTRELPAPGDPRLAGLASGNAYVRAFAVRGLGRLENPAVLDVIVRVLGDTTPEVRGAAANAIAQSLARPLPAAASPDDRTKFQGAVDRARSALTAHQSRENDPAAKAMTLESIGRLPQGSVEQVRATARVIAPFLAATSTTERRGAIRGLFFLARKPEARAPRVIPVEVTDKLYAMLNEPASAGFTATDRFNVAFVLTGTAAMSEDRSRALIEDRDPFVRDRAVVALSRSNDLPAVRAIVARALSDAQPVVRFRALNVFAQKLRATDGCAPLIALARDADMNVALGATDALSGCRNDATVAQHLRAVAASFEDNDRWHLPVHAFVSLSVVDSAAARPMLARFMTARNFFVRMYADTAARLMGDVASLYLLSRDSHPNVQASAIAALSRLIGHAADTVYIRALGAEDNQVLMAASAALKGTSRTDVAPLVQTAWNVRRRRDIDTERDGTTALRELLESLTGRPVRTNDTGPNAIARPTFEQMASLEAATARIEMMDGAVISMRLHPFDAPTNALRFATLARAGKFDGLTFHRVAPFFVVQGPGPFANEYSAPDGPYARDELALSNVRGTVGLSTRGRDTGDGQIYVNTVDNVWLDHNFTVMATITSGLEAFDRMQEGARIRRITITP